MGEAIPRHHPAVVLRSQFNELRALLAVALVAVAGLTVAVVILANESDQVGSTSAARAIEAVGDRDFNPPRTDWLLPKWTPEAGPSRIARPGSETEFHGSKASEAGPSRFARPGSETEFHGSKASEAGPSRFARPGSETDLPGRASAVP